MKLFKNKFFLICLCVAVALAGVTSTFSLMGYRGLVRNILGIAATPFRWVAMAFTNAADGFGKYFQSVKGLTAQNEALEQELFELRERLERAAIAEKENERLRAYLNMKAQNPGFSFEEGTVIGREASNYITVFTLNRGSIHGIQQNMPVVTERGIVGCVTEVGLTWCKVSTILESARSVGVYIPLKNVAGILNGDNSMRNEGLCRLTFLDIDTKDPESEQYPKPGDVVYSNGIGSVYPPDLKVGTIVSVDIDNATRTLIATVRPEADLSEPEHLMIITGYVKDS